MYIFLNIHKTNFLLRSYDNVILVTLIEKIFFNYVTRNILSIVKRNVLQFVLSKNQISAKILII